MVEFGLETQLRSMKNHRCYGHFYLRQLFNKGKRGHQKKDKREKSRKLVSVLFRRGETKVVGRGG